MVTTLTAEKCRGNWGTLLLPINTDDSIDFYRLSEEIDRLIAAKVDGIYSNGTAGEFHTQTEDEFDCVNQLLAEKCSAKGMLFQVGASHSVPITAVDRIRRSKKLNPAAYQVILPDWVAVNLEEALIFLNRIAAVADPIPLVLYNPRHAKKVLSPEDLLTLSEKIPSLISIKLLDGDEAWYERMKPVAGKVAVFVPGHHLATGVHRGVASGAYSNVACINPWAAQHWWHMMQTAIGEALQVEQCIHAFFSSYIVPFAQKGYSNPALDKLLATVGGWADIGTRLRWPYRSIPMTEVADVKRGATKILPSWFFEVRD
ncbi:dihydrodipicolinate synthase family protein [Parapedobacter sp. DT-150]|uniref:dihydrodipicolinate synthase family protein n=1 Tax=Parapedobacter sp. DT-150 TaxID=3396162 RepID=UPI003F1AE34B